MNGCCSSKDKKVIKVFDFSKKFLNFAILKSSPNSETDHLIKKCFQYWSISQNQPLIQI